MSLQYAIRVPANKSLELEIEDILFRPPGRSSRKHLVGYKGFRCQAESWSKARRIVVKVEHHQGELFPRVGFIVTSMSLPTRSVVRFQGFGSGDGTFYRAITEKPRLMVRIGPPGTEKLLASAPGQGFSLNPPRLIVYSPEIYNLSQ